ncbi:MAG: HEAT repeat domain-containing protein [Cyanobacteriota bacterium]|nr:HEAT repeat domain-containing protein [Cyanobacteriota bacterium]
MRSPLTPVELLIETVRALSWIETAAALEYLQQTLMAELNNTNSPVCQEIVTVLGRVEKPELKAKAAEIMIDLLDSNHPAVESVEIKQSLALGLGQLGDMRGLDALILMLSDADNSVRLHCMAALKQLGAAEARQQLESLVKQESIEPRLKQGIAIALREWPQN